MQQKTRDVFIPGFYVHITAGNYFITTSFLVYNLLFTLITR